MNSLEALATLMMSSDTADVDVIEVRDEATAEGWAALAKALSKTSVRVDHLLDAEDLIREAREEDLEIIYEMLCLTCEKGFIAMTVLKLRRQQIWCP